MRKGRYLIPTGQLLLLFCMMRSAPPAFASPVQATASYADLASATLALPSWHRPWRHIRVGWQENNQDIQVVANNVDNKYYRGHNQGNSGNSAVNRWYTEDHSSNAGNQIIHRGAIWHSRNNQLFRQMTRNSQNSSYVGYQQGNSGNSGVNRGYNRDTSGNLGNQDIG